MKPTKLIMSAWGSYPQVNQVDFSKFQQGQLFLITGATGSGKTTIFDGISYALYGKVSGVTRQEDQLRSDFASPEVETYVTLEFSHDGHDYRIHRCPKYLRPKKRGEGMTQKKEEAALYQDQELICSGFSQVNEKVHEILAVDYKQFKQLSMLAQGEFRDLLSATSKDRMEILRSIFHTQIYERIQYLAGNRARELAGQIKDLHSRMDEAVAFLEQNEEYQDMMEKEDYDGIMAKMAKDISKEKEKAQIAKEAIGQSQKNLNATKVKIQQAKDLREEYQGLQGEIKRLFVKQENDEQVLSMANQEVVNIEQEEVGMQEKKKEKQVLEEIKKSLEQGHELKVSLEKAKNEEKEQQEKIHIATYQQWKKEEQKVQQAEKALNQVKEAITVDQKTYQKLDRDLIDAKDKLTRMQSNYYASRVGEIAASLKEGEPCPVCGSVDHPQLAKVTSQAVSKENLDEKAKSIEDLQSDFNQFCQAFAQKKEQARVGEEQLKEKREALPPKPQWKEDWSEYLNIPLDRDEEQQKWEATKEEYAILCGKWEALPENVKEQLNKEDELDQKITNLTEEMEDFDQRKEKARKNLESAKIAQAKNSTLLKEKQTQETTKREHVPQDQDMEQLEEKQNIFQQQVDLLSAKEIESSLAYTQMEAGLRSLEKKRKQGEKLEKVYGLIGDVNQLLNGNNQLRLTLEQYVLTSYFQDILKAANLRLSKMTGGRYEMYRQESVSDGRKKDHLEIEVMDYYTGKKRSIRTLSGGESFKAALCLALGLSDIIGQYAGGIQMDVLFVDEGFGSLDEESLDQAISTLIALTGEQRMVGIISHVTELQERIDQQIVVEKGKEGSYIR